MDKVNSLTAKRIDRILDDTIESLSCILSVPIERNEDFQTSVNALGDDATQALRDQWSLERKMMEKGYSLDGKTEQLQRCSAISRDERERLHEQTRLTAKVLRSSMDDNLKSHSYREPHALSPCSSEKLLYLLRELKKLSVEGVAMTVEQDKARASAERRAIQERRKSLFEKEKVELEACRNDPEISSLETRLQKLRNKLTSEMEKLQAQSHLKDHAAAEEATKERSAHEELKHDLLAKIAALEIKFNQMKERNKQIEDGLGEETNEIETRLSQEKEKYGHIIEGKKKHIDDIKAKMVAEQSHLRQLQAHFSLIDRNNELVKEEAGMLAEVKAMEDAAMDVLNNAASHMQRLFRGKRDRQEAANKRKKKSKKGKGKGKGKGKKGKIVKKKRQAS